MPQPVSGVPSPSSRERTPFATRDCRRRNPVSLRVTRWPWNSTHIRVGRIAARGKQLRQIGGIVLTIAIERADPFSARVAHAGGDRGALTTSKRMPQQSQLRNAKRALLMTAAAVRSVLPSSTNSTSNARPANAAAISCASGPTFSSSLQTGTTIEISGVITLAHRASRAATTYSLFRSALRQLSLNALDRFGIRHPRHIVRRAERDDDA